MGAVDQPNLVAIHTYPFLRSSSQVNEYKYEMERITRELQDAKRKHYEHKRREQVCPELHCIHRRMRYCSDRGLRSMTRNIV